MFFFQFGALNLSLSHKQFTQFIQLLDSSFKFVFQHFSTENNISIFYLGNCKKYKAHSKKLGKKETQKMVCHKSKSRAVIILAFQKHTLKLQFLESLTSLANPRLLVINPLAIL